MPNPRPAIPKAQDIALVAQVDRICPLCAAPLFYVKGGRRLKKYEIAHIYPLNPTKEEITLLQGEERLSSDVNHDHNLIALCEPCHTKFDKPRTVEEYRKMVALKKSLIRRDEQQALWEQYPIESDIRHVIDKLYSEIIDASAALSLNPLEIDRKLDGSILHITRKKIKDHVAEYYEFIKSKMAEMDATHPGSAVLIASEVKTFYLKQKTLSGGNQQQIYDDVVNWVFNKTKPRTRDGAEIVTSFFVQNCEIFE